MGVWCGATSVLAVVVVASVAVVVLVVAASAVDVAIAVAVAVVVAGSVSTASAAATRSSPRPMDWRNALFFLIRSFLRSSSSDACSSVTAISSRGRRSIPGYVMM